MTYTNFISYADLLTGILNKLRDLPAEKFDITPIYFKPPQYYVGVDDFRITLEKERKEHCTIRGCEYKDIYKIIILKNRDSVTLDDEGIDTNELSVRLLRELFHKVESYFDKKSPVDKNKVLLEELVKKLEEV